MFVHSLFKEEITYRAHGRKFVIKPGMNNLTGITKEELVKTFGDIDLIFVTDETGTPVINEAPTEVGEDAPENTPVEDEGHDVLKGEGDEAGDGDQADDEPKPDNAPVEPVADKKEDGEAVKTETEPKAPAKATVKATAKKATGKKNK